MIPHLKPGNGKSIVRSPRYSRRTDIKPNGENVMNKKAIGLWILRVVPAVIILQTLVFKFGGAQESIDLFTELGAEPVGRIGSGIIELIVAVMLLIPRTTFYGAVGTVMVMVGALGAHVTKLGFAGDMGSLAVMAIVTLVFAAAAAFLTRPVKETVA